VPWPIQAVTLLVVASRLWLLPRLGLFNDEAYYWEWSRRLASSYYDHPPVVAYLIAASTRLLGHTQLAVHLPALVASALTSAVLFRLALDVFPGRHDLAWWSIALCNVAPLFGMGAVFTTPDAPCVLAWALTAWLVWRAIHGAPRLWYAAGVTAGLGLLSKYTFVLLPPGILLYLLVQPRHRGWLRRREPWIAAATMLLLFVPVILWNHDHGWASFRFQLVERHTGGFRPWRTAPRFLVAQLSLSPLLWLAMLAGMVRSWRAARAGSDAHAFLLACGAVILVFFAGAALFTYVNPNWFAAGYLTLLLPTAEVLAGARSRLIRVAPVALAAALTLLSYVQARTLLLPLPPAVDLATDLTGWDEVGARLHQLAAGSPDRDRPLVFSSRFQLSALADFYGGEGLEITRIGPRRDAYYDWQPTDGWRGRAAIYFTDERRFQAPDPEFLGACARSPDLPIVRGGRTIRIFSFWRCTGRPSVIAPKGQSGAEGR
jgi:4-amino-4-deoxy-L-arabinose transferase-like glycosyltransferase